MKISLILNIVIFLGLLVLEFPRRRHRHWCFDLTRFFNILVKLWWLQFHNSSFSNRIYIFSVADWLRCSFLCWSESVLRHWTYKCFECFAGIVHALIRHRHTPVFHIRLIFKQSEVQHLRSIRTHAWPPAVSPTIWSAFHHWISLNKWLPWFRH